MKKWKFLSAGLLIGAGLVSEAAAQPGVPAAPPPPPPPVAPPVPGATAVAAGPGAVAVAAPANNIWSFLCKTPEQRAACNERFCAGPFGKLARAMGGPTSLMTGGLFGNCCPLNRPTAADLAKPATSSEGAAARIKQDEAEAKARREAVRYLGTVDCRYWPEAEEALIGALRADKNECVRWEAALALQRGCCCTTKVIEALNITVSGSERDGQPAERSPRVIEAASLALSLCTADLPIEAGDPSGVPVIEEKKEVIPVLPSKEAVPGVPGMGLNSHQRTLEYYRRIANEPRAKVVENARRTLQQHSLRQHGTNGFATAAATQRPASNGLFGVVTTAFNPPAGSVGAEPALMAGPMGNPVQLTSHTEKHGLLYKVLGTPTGTVVPAFGPSTAEPPRDVVLPVSAPRALPAGTPSPIQPTGLTRPGTMPVTPTTTPPVSPYSQHPVRQSDATAPRVTSGFLQDE